MSDPRPAIGEEELHAYVDDRLDPVRRAAVEAYLEARPEEARRLASYRRQNELLRRAFAEGLAGPVPPALVAAATAGRRSAVSGWQRWAAAVLLLLAGLSGGWFGRGLLEAEGGEARILALAAEAHRLYVPEQRHPVEVAAAEEAHLVAWLSKRLDHPLSAPSLASEGLSLVGGRLLPAAGGRPAAQFMYEDASGRRFTCYVTRGSGTAGERGFRLAERDGVTAFLWYEEGLAYALVGESPREELLKLARALSERL